VALVKRRDGEDIASLARRFKRAVMTDGVIHDMRRREAYEKPSEKQRRKSHANALRAREAAMVKPPSLY